MSGRPKIFDEDDVIRKATTVFWTKGYEPASTEELLEAMGIGKGSFYLAFKGGKKELFERVLEQFSKEQLIKFRKKLDDSDDQVETLKDLFRDIATGTRHAHQKGCIFGNTLAELSNSDVILRDKAVNLLHRLETLFLDVIRKAQASGRLKNRENPELIAQNLITIWNGLGITRRMYPDNNVLRGIVEMQLQFLR
ncbi:TetR/AcrR family transcriptional regulator [Chitinophaga barathri]|uniref:TetR/AcrR family transcriptional regulator n=1 Tax=Chitinophaga barathri TaxID=1647451 RepID=A0A3N4MBE5_9BACT|nr:TetR/AcrR family transcriptional regulator [Chitinophaga barathri]RPD41154.1 TetR/AcrR family transcriptional regulator [Chitinophaga barathri]